MRVSTETAAIINSLVAGVIDIHRINNNQGVSILITDRDNITLGMFLKRVEFDKMGPRAAANFFTRKLKETRGDP